ncbi:Cellulose synthase operon protein C precursor [Serratia fonticola]|uniref:Cellulose synthase operon protein C n=1 Tax=Serratia fonticola TaxID=47917 RepID=A0A4U9VV02_SERFO|nr:Cellulose synthase operon protein C precursor [Serratia fonticola]
MLWHYQKDLSGYSLGQGGYYSPQQYVSLAVPVNYRQRTENWSWEVGARCRFRTRKPTMKNAIPCKD